MGQYYYVVNLDKKEYIHPHKMGDGLKLLEFACSTGGTMTALAILLAEGNGKGGGDLRGDHPVIGSWAGDRIVIAGDYADKGTWFRDDTIHKHASKHFREISQEVREAMSADEYLESTLSAAW
jgi:hypothetical protein